MPTRNLKFLANRYYHIYNRGANHGAIFFLEDNYTYLLHLLKKNQKRYDISIAAYCLMPNHYHLLLKPHRDDTISAFMQSLFGAYTQAVNRQQSRQGTLFQGRFRAIWVSEEGYFSHLACYIHANPVLAGLTQTCQDWLYSNYLDVIGERGGTLKNDDVVPARFATGAAYQQFVEAYITYRREVRGLERYLLE
jgi:REP element-mobilizing transposase RayT